MKSWVFLALLIFSCSSNPPTTTFQGIEMTMPYRIVIGHSLSPKQRDILEEKIRSVFYEVYTVYDRWNSDSEIAKINQNKGPFILSDKLRDLFEMVDQIHQKTEGRFDPTIFPILEGQMLLSSKQVGWKNVQRRGNHLTKGHSSMAFDFSGIAKGYCVDLLAKAIEDLGYQSFLIEWAGDIRAAGRHPENRPWWIQLKLTQSMQAHYPIVYLHNSSIATSSESISPLKDDDMVYSHIIDPIHLTRNIKSSESLLAASAQAPDCALADAIATAALTFANHEEATKWAKHIAYSNPEIIFWLVKKEQDNDPQ